MPQRLKQYELQDKRTNQNTGLEEEKTDTDYQRVTRRFWATFSKCSDRDLVLSLC